MPPRYGWGEHVYVVEQGQAVCVFTAQSTVDEPGGEPKPRELAIPKTAGDAWGSVSRIWPYGTHVSEVFKLLHIDKHMSLTCAVKLPMI